jgi:hypothetical protein
MYGVQPRQISTGPVRRVTNGYEIDGTADKGPEGLKELSCVFDVGRAFAHVRAMTPDGE